ncbi:MAG: DUF6259 domain-containing protein [Verrucomicrobiae bacterium]|nr:DUF6259 domain-containing protein [Verrucomicrobiae bacterium]
MITLPSGRKLELHPPALRQRDPVTFEPVADRPPVRATVVGDAHDFRVRVTNESNQPVLLDVFAALLVGLREAGAKVYVPHIGGAVLPVASTNYESHVFGQLCAAWMIVQVGEEGVVLAQEKTTEDEARYRTGILVHAQGLPAGATKSRESTVVGSAVDARAEGPIMTDLGGVAGFAENLRLPAGATWELGPYRLATYRGDWTGGAALLRQLRRPRVLRRWPAWFQPVRSVSEINTDKLDHFADLPRVAAELRAWGAPVFHLFLWQDRSEEMNQPHKDGVTKWDYGVNPHWAYAFDQPQADPRRGGDEGLRRAIRETQRSGSKVLLYVTPWTLASDSAVGKRAAAEQLIFREPNGNEFMESESYRFCPMVPAARAWIVEALVRTIERYEVDGLFIDQTAAIGNHPCAHPAHRHENPYVWTYGVWLLFKELRAALDARRPEALLLLEGGSELLREFADGYLAHSHSWTNMRHDAPVTRAVQSRIGIFDSFNGYTFDAPDHVHEHCRKLGMVPRSPQYMAAMQFAGGIHYYADQADIGRARWTYERHQPVRLAYPEMIDGEICAALPRFELPSITGYLFEHDGRLVMSVADLGGTNFTAGRRVRVRLPVGRGLYDRLASRFIPVENGEALIPLEGGVATAFEVIL